MSDIFRFYNNDEDPCENCNADYDCDNCEYRPVTLDDLLIMMAEFRLERLLRDAYDLGIIDKDTFTDIIGHSISILTGEDDNGC